QQRVQRIYAASVRETIRLRSGSITDQSDTRRASGCFTRHASDRCRLNTVLFLDRLRRIGGKVDARKRGPQLFIHDDVRDAERDGSFGSWRTGNPFIRIRAGLRDARFELHEFAALSRTPFAHGTVTNRLRHDRVPGAEKVRTERNDVVRVSQV